MKNIFYDKAHEDMPTHGKLPVTFYFGDIVKENGEIKLEWNDPIDGKALLTVEEIKEKDDSSRMKLGDKDHPIGGDAWKIQRNINYSAEYGLKKIKDFEFKLSVIRGTSVRAHHILS